MLIQRKLSSSFARDRGGRLPLFVIAIAGALVVAGCEKPIHDARATPNGDQGAVASNDISAASTDSTVGAIPSTQPAGNATVAAAHIAATGRDASPAVTQPAVAMLAIDGLSTQFPVTKMLVHEKDGGKRIVAELFSDLPASALHKYDGNELYFEMQLQNAEGQHVDKATWAFKSTSSGKVDSPNGIFLNGQQVHLQPDDVRVTFSRHADGLLFAHVRGRFRAYESDTPDALAPFAGVDGEVAVKIVQQR